MRIHVFLAVFLIVVVYASNLSPVSGQVREGDKKQGNSLNEKVSRLMEGVETYKHYKVIPTKDLDNLWKETADSLARYRQNINQLNNEMVGHKNARLQSVQQLEQIQEQLKESRSLNGKITFLGIPFPKTTYNIGVWSIMGLLVLISVALYLRFKACNRITKTARRDLEEVKEEYENYRKVAVQKQMQTKRELQTAINKLEDRKVH